MTRSLNAPRRRTRHLLMKGRRQKGKISLTRYFAQFKAGDHVQMILEPAIHKGTYNTRFYGRAGVIKSKQGSCYLVEVYDKNKKKTILSHPIHMKRSHE